MTLPRSTPSAQGVDPVGIDRFIDAVAESGVELHSLMLLRHGQVIAEGWWAPYSPAQVHLLYSLSKSFTSTAIGLAVAEGRLSVDDTVVSFFPDAVPADPSPHLLNMRVHNLLSMGTGHQEDTTRQVFAEGGGDPVRSFFAIPPDQEPGSVFAYNSTATYMLSAILTALTGESLTGYLRPRLFDPLGIDQAYWQSRNSVDIGFSGLHVVTESIAKLGQLYLQRGRWGDRQLVPESWVAAATSWQIDTVTPWRQSEPVDWRQGYGYQFWRCQHNAYRADGAYGQFCVVIPDSDLVLATTAATSDMQAILTAAWTHLLPALDSTAPAATGAEDALRERLAGLRLPTVAGSRTGTETGPAKYQSAVPAAERALFPAVEVLTVTPTDEGWSLRFDDNAEIATGHEAWVEGVVTGQGPVDVPVAGSAGWNSADTFEAEIIFLDTPHRLRITCAAGTFTQSWSSQPLHGGAFAGLAAPRPTA
ncbi:MAG TPA: serine hydrolase [Mycobacteriales bacterium]|nr:serine hydrolase [Mycobacteriales bacterium]